MNMSELRSAKRTQEVIENKGVAFSRKRMFGRNHHVRRYRPPQNKNSLRRVRLPNETAHDRAPATPGYENTLRNLRFTERAQNPFVFNDDTCDGSVFSKEPKNSFAFNNGIPAAANFRKDRSQPTRPAAHIPHSYAKRTCAPTAQITSG